MTAPASTAPVIDCETTVRRLWDFLDGRLAAVPRAQVEAHLAACAFCPPHFAFAREVQGALAAGPAGPPDDGALAARVRAALRRHAAGAGPT